MMAGSGEVIAITGSAELVTQVFVIKANGQKIPLKIGDTIDPGDVIITPVGVQVEVQAGNGQIIEVSPEQTVAFTSEMIESGTPPDIKSATTDGATIETVIQAISEGKDIGDLLEETAAGQQGGSGNEGGNDEFEELVRLIVQSGEPITYAYATNPLTESGENLFALPVEDLLAPIDLTPPDTPTFVGIDDVGTITGQIVPNSSIDDNLPEIRGTGGVPGDIIEVSDNGIPLGTTTVQPDGTWSFTPTTPLNDGPHSITTTARDPAGNVSAPSAPLLFDVDTVAPNTPTFVGIDDVGTITGQIVPNSSIDDNLPEIRGTGGVAGDIIEVSDNGVPLGTTTVQPDGTWTFTPTTPLNDGPHSITTTARDPAGNVSAPSAPLLFDVDTVAPNSPTFVGIDDVGTITGQIVPNSSIDDNLPEIRGTGGVAGDIIEVSDNGVPLGTTTVQPDGTWSFTPTTPLNDGPHSITTTARDPAGNVSAPSAPLLFDVDTVAPNSPTFVGIDDVGTITGQIVPNSSIDDNLPEIRGTGGVAGDIIEVSDNGVPLGTTTVQPDGTWSFTPTTPLNDGPHSITTTARDPAGNVSAPSAPLLFDVDTVAPNSPAFTLTDDVNPLTGLIADGATTDDNTPTVNGIGGGEPGNTITILDNGVPIGTAIVQADGTWTFTPTTPLLDGPHRFTTTETDAAGNISPPTLPTLFTVDTSGIAVPIITGIIDDFAPQVGAVATNGFTNDTTPTINGTAPSDAATVNVFVNGVEVATGVPVTAGVWTYTVPAGSALPEGQQIFTATAVKAGTGEISDPSSPYAITIDTTVPTAPIIVSVVDDVGSVQGVVANGADTNDTTPTISGTAEAGTLLTLRDGSTVIGTTTVAADGTWTITTSELSSGIHEFTATTTDAAGNVSPVSNLYGVNIDLAGPTNVSGVLPETLIDDTGASQSDNITSNRAPMLTGTTEQSTDTVVVTVDGTSYTATVAADGTWTVALTGANLADGTYTPSVTSTDVAGNATTVAGETFTIDSTAPGAPAFEGFDDVGAITGVIVEGSTIDDARPEFRNPVGQLANPGDTITIVNNGVTLGTTIVDNNGNWTFTPTTDLIGTTQVVTFTATDPAGNVSAPSTLSFTLDVSPPSAQISIDANVAGDGIVNAAEASAGVEVLITGTVGGAAKVGDLVTINVGSTTYAPVAVFENTAGQLVFSASIPGVDLANFSGRQVGATLSFTNAAGNPGTASDTQAYTVDLNPANTLITIDANVAGDGIVQPSELANPITITGSVGGAAKVGDVVTLNVGGITATVNVVDLGGGKLGFTSTDFTGQQLADFAGRAVSASITVIDENGVTLNATDTANYIVDNGIDARLPTIALDANIAGDGVININESNGTVAVTGTVAGIAKVGDVVVVTINGVAIPTTVQGVPGNLTFSVNVAGSQIVANPLVSAVITSVDEATGDTVNASTSFEYGVDITAPSPVIALDANIAVDGIINLAESQGTIAVTGTVAGDAKVGDPVSVFVNGVTYSTQVVALAGGQLGFSVDVPGAALAADPDIEASVTTTDAAGNVGIGETAASYGVDLNPPSATVSVSEEGLLNGNPDNIGNPDTTNLTTISGTINVNVGTVTLTAPAEALTSGGVPVTWTGSGTNTIIGSAGGEEVLRATIDNSGNYTVNLSKAVDHPVAGEEDLLSLAFGVVVTDAAGGINPGTLHVNIEDDSPVAINQFTRIADIVSNTDTVNSSGNIGLGADGGYVGSVTHAGITYTFDGVNTVTSSNGSAVNFNTTSNVLIIATINGSYAINLLNGDYVYTTTAAVISQGDVVLADLNFEGLPSYGRVAPPLGWFTDNSNGLVEIRDAAIYGVVGSAVIELEALPGDGNFYTVIADTLAGQAIQLSLDYAARAGFTEDSHIEVVIDGVVIDTLNTQSTTLTSFNYNLVGTGADMRVEFRSVDTNSTGGVLDNIKLTTNPTSDIERFDFTLVDNDGDTANASLNIQFRDNPLLTLTNDAPPTSTGLLFSTYDLPAGTLLGGVGANLEALTESNAATSRVRLENGIDDDTNPNGNRIEIPEGDMVSVTGLIYLEAGKSYVLSGQVDDTFRIELGGVVVLNSTGLASGDYNTVSGDLANNPQNVQVGGAFVPTVSGYYTLEAYAANNNDAGNLSINIAVDGAPAVPLDATNFKIYATVADIVNGGGQFGTFVPGANGDGGYLPVQSANIVGAAIALANITINLSTAEVISSVEIGGIPVGSELTDGVNTFTATAANMAVDVKDWVLDNISITPPSSFVAGDSFDLLVKVTTQNSSGAINTDVENMTISIVDNVANSSIEPSLLSDGTAGNDVIIGGSGNDVIEGGAGNDVLTGNSGADVFKWSLGDDGTLESPANDIITDFNPTQGDSLDLRDLLVGENAANIGNFLTFEQSGLDTIVHVNSTGNLSAGDTQTITLQGVSLTDLGGADSAAVIASMLANNNLIIDQ
jgi:T1SS-143 domain-containing protein